MPNPVRVLVVDDDPLARQAIVSILESADDLAVVGEAGDGVEAVAAAREHAADVVLMDLRMPRVDGVAATRELRELAEAPHVLVLTSWDVNDAVLRSLNAGADGFLLKTSAPGEIIAAVRNVAAGDAVLSPSSTRQLVDHVTRSQAADERVAAAALVGGLSPREREVAAAVAEGLSNAQISARLYLSVATVKSHLAAVQSKLGVTNRVGVAVLTERARLGR